MQSSLRTSAASLSTPQQILFSENANLLYSEMLISAAPFECILDTGLFVQRGMSAPRFGGETEPKTYSVHAIVRLYR